MLPDRRLSGVLLHPTAMPGGYGIGDLGASASEWVAWLASTGCGAWQILPIGPTGFGDSPYQLLSTFAGNPLLISLDQLHQAGLLPRSALALDAGPPDRVDYETVIRQRDHALRQAHAAFRQRAGKGLLAEYEAYLARQADWLEPFALFMALKDQQSGRAWDQWPVDWRQRQPEALETARREMAEQIDRHRFCQFVFDRQWQALRDQCRQAGILIIGDLPIYVAHDSADVWAQPEVFQLDDTGQPQVVGGVPPDYFSEDGQRWGNPIYRWDRMQTNDFAWWIARLRRTLEWVDVVRLDHFRGFEAFWQIPAEEPSAVKGRWQPGPGAALFRAIESALGALPLIAEDLGVMTPGVVSLRQQFGLPGMNVLQFAFDGGADNPYLPHNHRWDSVVYTGTHDNDTTRGWYETADPAIRRRCQDYLGLSNERVADAMVRTAWASVCRLAVAPLQDLLELGSEARFNRPGVAQGNWRWRATPGALDTSLAERLAHRNQTFGRTTASSPA
ncbi:MAG TPA: 4-alpha-glucanotransferase [Anaerolineales bacterium]